MKKKIFIITGESSGDKIASYIINHIKNNNSEIEFLAIGGENIKYQRVNCIFAQECCCNMHNTLVKGIRDYFRDAKFLVAYRTTSVMLDVCMYVFIKL